MKSLIPEPIRKMSKIELITFDLDDTFWDIRSTIINAENNSRKWTENRIGEKIGIFVMKSFSPLFLGKMKKYKPIKVENVAKAMVKAVENDYQNNILESDEIMKISNS